MRLLIISFLIYSCFSLVDRDIPLLDYPSVTYYPQGLTNIRQLSNNSLIQIRTALFNFDKWNEHRTTEYHTWTQIIHFHLHIMEKYEGKPLLGDMTYYKNVTFQMPLKPESFPDCFNSSSQIFGEMCVIGDHVLLLDILDSPIYVNNQFMYVISYRYKDETFMAVDYNPSIIEMVIQRNYGHLSIVHIPSLTSSDNVPEIQLVVRC